MAHFTHSGNVRKLEQAQGITREDAFLLAVIMPLEIYDGLKPFLNNVIQKKENYHWHQNEKKKTRIPGARPTGRNFISPPTPHRQRPPPPEQLTRVH